MTGLLMHRNKWDEGDKPGNVYRRGEEWVLIKALSQKKGPGKLRAFLHYAETFFLLCCLQRVCRILQLIQFFEGVRKEPAKISGLDFVTTKKCVVHCVREGKEFADGSNKVFILI